MAKTGFNEISKIRILTRTPFRLNLLNPNLNRKIARLILHNSLVNIDILSLIVSPLGDQNQFALPFFYRKFLSQQPEVVESRVIAHFLGFCISNTIKWVLGILETEFKKEENCDLFYFVS